MMESPFALERELGMQYYATVTPGIGGILRSVPEDFIVDEIPLEKKGTSGPYLICRLTKSNWELQHAVKEIARRLGNRATLERRTAAYFRGLASTSAAEETDLEDALSAASEEIQRAFDPDSPTRKA